MTSFLDIHHTYRHASRSLRMRGKDRSAIEWIMESYQVKIHKESGVVYDPNDWEREHNNRVTSSIYC